MPTVAIKCKQCQQDFDFTEGEQQFFQNLGYQTPARCKPCRQARKNVVAGGAAVPVAVQREETNEQRYQQQPRREWTNGDAGDGDRGTRGRGDKQRQRRGARGSNGAY